MPKVDVYTPAQVAEILQLSKQTIYMLISTKQLKSRKIGRYYRIKRSDLVDFLEK